MVDDIIFHKLSSPLAHQSPDSILEILATVKLYGPEIPHDIQISCLDYTT